MAKTLIEKNVVTCIINIVTYYYRGLDNLSGKLRTDDARDCFGDNLIAELDKVIACYSSLHAAKAAWAENWNKENCGFETVIKDMKSFFLNLGEESSLPYFIFRDYFSQALTAIINGMEQREKDSSGNLRALRQLVNKQIVWHNAYQYILTQFANNSDLLTNDELFQNSFVDSDMYIASYIRLIKGSSAGSRGSVEVRINNQLQVFAKKISSSANTISSALSDSGLIAPTLAPSVSGEGSRFMPKPSFRVSDAAINAGIAASMGTSTAAVPLQTNETMVLVHEQMALQIDRDQRKDNYDKQKKEGAHKFNKQVVVEVETDDDPSRPLVKVDSNQDSVVPWCCLPCSLL